jgi:hypothetical protein
MAARRLLRRTRSDKHDLESQAPLSAGLGDFASTKSFPIAPIVPVRPDPEARLTQIANV